MSTHSAYQEAGISLHNLCVIITLLYLPEALRKQQMIPFFSCSFGKAIIFVPVQEKKMRLQMYASLAVLWQEVQ